MSHNILDDSVYTYEYFRDENVCSLCWKKETVNITKALRKSRQNEVNYKIKDCFGLEFNNSCFQRQTCESCCVKVDEFYDFKQFCRETDRRLRELIKNHHNCNGIECINIQNSLSCVKIENVNDTFCENSTDFDLSPCYEEVKDENDFHKTKEHSREDICQNDDHEDKVLTEIVTANSQVKCFDVKICANKQSLNNRGKNKVLSTVKKKKYQRKRSPTYCNICRLDLGSIDTLATHNASNHGIEEGNKFKCFGCDKRFRTRKARLAHEINFCKCLKEGYKCVECDRFLPRRSMYEAHMRDHRERPKVELPEKIFQCATCCKMFKTKSSLTEHMVEHDSLKKHYVCETCGRVFSRQDYLHKHKLIHSGTKQHACPHCVYRTAQKSSLTVHIRKHTGERPYSCDLCPQRCISSSNLRAHRRRHLGDKTFECTICNKKFGYKISLEEHIASVHERSQVYPCDLCGAIYTRPRGLRRHRLAKHDKQKVDKSVSKDGSSVCEQSCTDPPRDGVSGKDQDIYLKIVDNIVDKKVTTNGSEIYEIKDVGELIILNSEGGAEIVRKLY